MSKVKLNDMELFQLVEVELGVYMRRVPGGWICKSNHFKDQSEAGVFIPDTKACGDGEYEVVKE